MIADWQATCCARIVQLGYVLRHCRPAKVVAIDNIYWMTIYKIYVVSQYTIYILSRRWLQYDNPHTHYQTVQPSSATHTYTHLIINKNIIITIHFTITSHLHNNHYHHHHHQPCHVRRRVNICRRPGGFVSIPSQEDVA